MPTIKKTLTRLSDLFNDERRLNAEIESARMNRQRDDFEEDRLAKKQSDLRQCQEQLESELRRFEREPDHHSRHFDDLARFSREAGSFEKSVFIMTKFPQLKEGKYKKEAERLACIIGLIRQGIWARGYVPHLASDTNRHRWLWDNVELYLLASHRGVAIVEDRYAPELNPNVAMEWGWMQGMGRDVLYLREQSFKHERADWEGLTSEEFDWKRPQPGIDKGLNQFLGPVQRSSST